MLDSVLADATSRTSAEQLRDDVARERERPPMKAPLGSRAEPVVVDDAHVGQCDRSAARDLARSRRPVATCTMRPLTSSRSSACVLSITSSTHAGEPTVTIGLGRARRERAA